MWMVWASGEAPSGFSLRISCTPVDLRVISLYLCRLSCQDAAGEADTSPPLLGSGGLKDCPSWLLRLSDTVSAEMEKERHACRNLLSQLAVTAHTNSMDFLPCTPACGADVSGAERLLQPFQTPAVCWFLGRLDEVLVLSGGHPDSL